MKSAEDWEQECWRLEHISELRSPRIKQIQLDAMKEGAKRAAELYEISAANQEEFPKARVLLHAENWTTKDL